MNYYFQKKTAFKDNFNNSINASSFRYSDKTELLKIENIEFIDNEKNRYFLEKAFLKIKENILLGKDIKINLKMILWKPW